MTESTTYAHWNEWASSVAEKAEVSGIVFLQLGSGYLATAEVLKKVGFTLVDANAFLDGDLMEGKRVVLTDLDALSSSSSAQRMGQLRALVSRF